MFYKLMDRNTADHRLASVYGAMAGRKRYLRGIQFYLVFHNSGSVGLEEEREEREENRGLFIDLY